MIELNDALFDDKIRKKLKDEINYVPNDINKKIDSTLSKINKKRFTIKKALLHIGKLYRGNTITWNGHANICKQYSYYRKYI